MTQISLHLVIPFALVVALAMAVAIDWQSRRNEREGSSAR